MILSSDSIISGLGEYYRSTRDDEILFYSKFSKADTIEDRSCSTCLLNEYPRKFIFYFLLFLFNASISIHLVSSLK